MLQTPSEMSSQPTGSASTALRRLRGLSHLLDNAIPIPGTRYRIGLDPILGLAPGFGDTVATALSAYIVVEAARMGLSRAILTQMVFNILLETAIGSVPVLGDIFDAAWKANIKNLELLESHLEVSELEQQPGRRVAILLLLIVGFTVVVVGFAIASIGLLLSILGR